MPLMITDQSFWLDEGDTGVYAIQPDFSSWLHHLLEDRNADCQMPLTMLTSWVVASCGGLSEHALRGQNFLFGGIALWAMFSIGRRTGIRWLPLLMAVQPFFWFYMDQARPYVSQIAGGALLAWVIAVACRDVGASGKWLLAFSLAALGTFMTSMLTGTTIAVVFFACIIWGGVPSWEKTKKQILGLSLTWMLCLILAAYFVWTVLRGAEGARIWVMDWKATAFIAYELLGCVGLGPSIEELRTAASASQFTALSGRLLLPLLLVFTVSILGIFYFFRSTKLLENEKRHFRACFIVLLLVSSLLVLISIAIHKPLWARHFSSVLPFLVCIEGYWISRAWSTGSVSMRALVSLFLTLLLASSLMVRFSPYFEKDDYRTAAAFALTALSEGNDVWWCAAEYTGVFYDLPVDTTGRLSTRAARVPRHYSDHTFQKMPHPNLIIITRPEVYDPKDRVRNFAKVNGFEIIASPKSFQIFAKRSQHQE